VVSVGKQLKSNQLFIICCCQYGYGQYF